MGVLYKTLRGLARVVTPRMETHWASEFDHEPSVFVCNHAGSWGPIDMCAKFPLTDECHVWLNADVMQARQVPAYVRQDYWWKPGCTLEWLYNATLPYIAAAVLPPVLRSVPETVPVYHDNRALTTMRKSIAYLKKGEHLIIFPEQPSGHRAHHDWINTGFLHVMPLYYRATEKVLKLYPVHLDHQEHVIQVAEPVAYDPSQTLEEQMDRIVEALAQGLAGKNAAGYGEGAQTLNL